MKIFTNTASIITILAGSLTIIKEFKTHQRDSETIFPQSQNDNQSVNNNNFERESKVKKTQYINAPQHSNPTKIISDSLKINEETTLDIERYDYDCTGIYIGTFEYQDLKPLEIKIQINEENKEIKGHFQIGLHDSYQLYEVRGSRTNNSIYLTVSPANNQKENYTFLSNVEIRLSLSDHQLNGSWKSSNSEERGSIKLDKKELLIL